MKKFILLFVSFSLMAGSIKTNASTVIGSANLNAANAITKPVETTPSKSVTPTEQFLKMTPSKYYKLTGKKMSLTQIVQLKAAQKIVKTEMKKANKGGGNTVDKTLYIVLAIVGLGFIGIGINDNWEGSKWIIALVLSILCWLPGVIYSLIKMKDYYN